MTEAALEDDKIDVAVIEPGADKEPAADALTPEQKMIEELKSKAASAEERAARAERERDTARVEKDSAKKETLTAREREIAAQEASVLNAQNAAKSNFEAAQKEWDDAYDSGDKNKVREAQIALNRAQFAMESAAGQVENFNRWKKSAEAAAAAPAPERFSKREKEWIAQNPRFETDVKFTSVVHAADAIARRQGIRPDTDAYFDFVEKALVEEGLKDDAAEPPKPEKKEKKTDRSSMGAPPNGASGGSSGSAASSRSIRLTADQQEAAAFTFPDLYRKDPKAALEKYGKMQLEIKEKKARGEI